MRESRVRSPRALAPRPGSDRVPRVLAQADTRWEPRATCLRCRRAAAVCWCADLVPIPSATHVVFLQHPRESRVAIGTARMAHLALRGSELHRGLCFETHPRVAALASDTGGAVAVLYPGDDAQPPEALDTGPPRTLIVLDGTWNQVRAMWRENPALHRLPRIGFVPARPGNYRIRREPAAHCLATVEAVVEVLGRFEGDALRFRPMLRAFERMVETQITYRTERSRPWRRTKRQRQDPRRPARETLAARHGDLVLVYAEANAHPTSSPDWGIPELIQLVAARPATGERVAAIIAPRRPLAASAAHHVELSSARLHAGEPVGGALARWRAFVRPTDLLCAWGHYPFDLLAREGDPPRACFDLRRAVNHELGRRAGGIERAAEILEVASPTPAWTDGRAGRRIAALDDVIRHLSGSLP
jgi:DTW domain-containing protein